MCFSANVSFTASIVLAIIGTCLLKKTKKQIFVPLALIPWFFAIQQASEGFVWLALPEESFARNIFLFFAYFVWPIWVPFSVWFAEENRKRKQILGIFLDGHSHWNCINLLDSIGQNNCASIKSQLYTQCRWGNTYISHEYFLCTMHCGSSFSIFNKKNLDYWFINLACW